MNKQKSTEEDWRAEWRVATAKHPLSEILRLKDSTEAIMSEAASKPLIIGYSGGKDSLVLRHMAEDCIDKPVFINCLLQNEYPRFEEWLVDTAPSGTVFVQDEELSLEYINEHPEFLFPEGKRERGIYVATFRKPTYKYLLEHGVHQFMTGKRFEDGNTCGPADGKGMHSTYMRDGDMRTLNPMAEWSHSQLMAYIQYFHIELPEIYSYPNGFRFGTHPWTERDRVDGWISKTFDEILEIDPSIVEDAAKRLDMARLYLAGQLYE